MRDPLKNYIDQHRTELDNAVPSDKLWTNIETAMTVAVPAAGIASTIPWLKYFAFGLSSVVGAGVIYTALNGSSPQPEIIQNIPAAPTAMSITANEPETELPVDAPSTTFVLASNTAALALPDEIPPVTEYSMALPVADSVPQEAVRFNAPAI